MRSSHRDRSKVPVLVRLSSVALFALALAGAQIAGLMHRVEHASLWAEAAHDHDHRSHSQDGDDHSHDHHSDEQAPEHNCGAYDAATLLDGPPQAIVQRSPNASVHAKPLRCIFAVADKSPHLPFHSRAPPRA